MNNNDSLKVKIKYKSYRVQRNKSSIRLDIIKLIMHTKYNMYSHLGYKITAGGGSKAAIVYRIITQTKRTFHNKNHLFTKKNSRLHVWSVALNKAAKQKIIGKVETFER